MVMTASLWLAFRLFATVTIKIEGEDTLVIDWTLEHFRVA